jgi:hypothetical protein
MNFRAKSPNRRSPKRKSPKRKSPKRRSPKRKSPNRRSPKRKSPKRKSPKRKSPKRKSPKRKSPNRRSPNRRSPKRGSPKRKYRAVRHNMLKGGTKEAKKCDVCHEYLAEKDGVEGIGKNRKGFWIHNEENHEFCSETAHTKKIAKETAELVKRELEKRAAETAVAMENYKDRKKYQNAKEKVRREIEIEEQRFNALSAYEQKYEEDGDFFQIPDAKSKEQQDIIFNEIRNRYAYKDKQKKQTDQTIKNLQDLMLYDQSTDKVLIVYSVASINKTDPRWTVSNPYSIEIHCTTFRPENNANDPPQNFYGHVSLNIHRGRKETGGIHTENYHYGIYNKGGKIKSFTRQFWSKNQPITKPNELIFINDGKNSHLEFLFPKISAGDLMIQYYNWCIRTCPDSRIPFSLEPDTFKRLTRWGVEHS